MMVIQASLPKNIMTDALRGAYGMDNNVHDFIEGHIADLKRSEEPAISLTGNVLEAAEHEFGIDYITPLIILATGHLLLGNPLREADYIATSSLNSNFMSCAAVGAIYYGWRTLHSQERDELVVRLSSGFDVGRVLVRCVINFLVDQTKEILDRNNLKEMKNYIGKAVDMLRNKFGEDTLISYRPITRINDAFKKTTGGKWGERLGAAKNSNDKTVAKIALLTYVLPLESNSKTSWNAATTCGQKISFSYSGSVAGGMEIFLSDESFRVDAEFLRAAVYRFCGWEVWGGFSLTKPTPGGFGEWIRDNSSSINCEPLTPRHASFIAAVLREEGFLTCDKVGNSVRLVFR